MTVTTPPHALRADTANGSVAGGSMRPLTTGTTQTEPAFGTTEFAVDLVAAVGVLIGAGLVGDSDGRGDVSVADEAWFSDTPRPRSAHVLAASAAAPTGSPPAT